MRGGEHFFDAFLKPRVDIFMVDVVHREYVGFISDCLWLWLEVLEFQKVGCQQVVSVYFRVVGRIRDNPERLTDFEDLFQQQVVIGFHKVSQSHVTCNEIGFG